MYYVQGDYLVHHGIKGQRWGIRRYQNPDGSLTSAGESRYGSNKVLNQDALRKWQKTSGGINPGPMGSGRGHNGGINPGDMGPSPHRRNTDSRMQRNEQRLNERIKRGELKTRQGKSTGKAIGKAIVRNLLITAGGTGVNMLTGNRYHTAVNIGVNALGAASWGMAFRDIRDMNAYKINRGYA